MPAMTTMTTSTTTTTTTTDFRGWWHPSCRISSGGNTCDHHGDSLRTNGSGQVEENSSDASTSATLPSSLHVVPTAIDCLCLGTGRFLRSVLVPALQAAGLRPALIQTRGRNFMEFMQQLEPAAAESLDPAAAPSWGYPVDTVLPNGGIQTDLVPCFGAFSLGLPDDEEYFYRDALPRILAGSTPTTPRPLIIGVGVTEAGLSSPDAPAMHQLYRLLSHIHQTQQQQQRHRQLPASEATTLTIADPKVKRLCVIDMDNVPNNGQVIRQHMITLASRSSSSSSSTSSHEEQSPDEAKATQGLSSMLEYVTQQVSFLDTMVDRITSERPDSDGLIPRAEPIPAKALVILDPHHDLPDALQRLSSSSSYSSTGAKSYGLVIRHSEMELQRDVQLKLRIANGTHTALAHAMALMLMLKTDFLALATPPPTSLSVEETEAVEPPTSAQDPESAAAASAAALLMKYVDALVETQIQVAAVAYITSSNAEAGIENRQEEARQAVLDTWQDWRRRLIHPHFGLSTFFITQNGAAKGGIRWGPTVLDLILQNVLDEKDSQASHVTSKHSFPSLHVSMAFSYAALLRWLTPKQKCSRHHSQERQGVFVGWLQGGTRQPITPQSLNELSLNESEGDCVAVEYADQLRYHAQEKWYEFKCPCVVRDGTSERNLSDWLQDLISYPSAEGGGPQQPVAYHAVIRAYLLSESGGRLGALLEHRDGAAALDTFAAAIATLYARMIAGDDLLAMLREMSGCQGVYMSGFATPCYVLLNPSYKEVSFNFEMHIPLHYRASPIPLNSALLHYPVPIDDLGSVVISEVASALVVDLHTHLLPPSHGPLCLWGIDELLTYHYLVAEYFMTAPAERDPVDFYALSKRDQADLIWKALFVDRLPVSEACRGVVTVLSVLGLQKELLSHDLEAIRNYYGRYREKGESGIEEFSLMVHRLSGVRYNIMTNIPFDPHEAQYWQPHHQGYPDQYKSALRVDPFLTGDIATIEFALKTSGYDVTIEGARQYLRDWCDIIKPEYMMASTPHHLAAGQGLLADVPKTGINEDAFQVPGAFTKQFLSNQARQCDGAEDEQPSFVNERSDYMTQVLIKVCEERNLPIALKIGAHRSMNPALKAAGDGMVAFADAGLLARLCERFPKVRFLATFLSRNNQHEACVLATKFRNLHIYGCWWFCNNPSIIREITQMRIEMLGTAFTAQHSDARVLDQLLYKWPHSRAVIANVLTGELRKLASSGWRPTRAEIRREVNRLFGGSYEEFTSKSFV